MILLDTTILVAHLRKPEVIIRRVLATGTAAVCGVTWAELLHGARTPAESRNTTAVLNSLPQLPIPEAIWPALGANLSVLRNGGVTLPFQDALLATVAIHHDVEIWTRDTHFALIQKSLPVLRLFTPPSASP